MTQIDTTEEMKKEDFINIDQLAELFAENGVGDKKSNIKNLLERIFLGEFSLEKAIPDFDFDFTDIELRLRSISIVIAMDGSDLEKFCNTIKEVYNCTKDLLYTQPDFNELFNKPMKEKPNHLNICGWFIDNYCDLLMKEYSGSFRQGSFSFFLRYNFL